MVSFEMCSLVAFWSSYFGAWAAAHLPEDMGAVERQRILRNHFFWCSISTFVYCALRGLRWWLQ